MRIPKITNYSKITSKEVVHIPKIELEETPVVFFDEKQRKKYIDKLERICRHSLEYREFIMYLRVGLGMHFCTFFNNLDADNISKLGIEIHHIPFTLFDICSIVLRKWEMEKIPLNDLLIAEEVMKNHYMGEVGLVPLSTTVHELVHTGELFIPLQYVDKGFIKFYEKYKAYMSDQQIEVLQHIVTMSKNYDVSHPSILDKKFIYVDNEGYSATPDKL